MDAKNEAMKKAFENRFLLPQKSKSLKAGMDAVGALKDTPVRFFMWDEDEDDIVECTEYDFEQADGVIEYIRHTMHDNGVNQVCLTKVPR